MWVSLGAPAPLTGAPPSPSCGIYLPRSTVRSSTCLRTLILRVSERACSSLGFVFCDDLNDKVLSRTLLLEWRLPRKHSSRYKIVRVGGMENVALVQLWSSFWGYVCLWFYNLSNKRASSQAKNRQSRKCDGKESSPSVDAILQCHKGWTEKAYSEQQVDMSKEWPAGGPGLICVTTYGGLILWNI